MATRPKRNTPEDGEYELQIPNEEVRKALLEWLHQGKRALAFTKGDIVLKEELMKAD